MHELVINMHMHTTYSDGSGSHAEIAQAALHTGLDGVIITDHNVLVRGPEGYYKNGPQRVLVIVGEEVHDQARVPQKNHLLVIGMDRGMATLAPDPQRLLDGVREANGLSFLAHPCEFPAPAIGEPDLSWVDWDIHGFTGIELWNAMTEMKSLMRSKLHAVFYAFNPFLVARQPFTATLRKWDELLNDGHRVVATGGSDAHAFKFRLGPLKRIVFPYQFHFQAINTHLFTPQPLSGEPNTDREAILTALRRGNAFIGYDLPAPTHGFRFTAQGKDGLVLMGDEISGRNSVTLQVRLPRRTECRLIRGGEVVKQWKTRETCTHITDEPGAYRVEVYIPFRGRRRGWIFSNPIYVR